MKLKYAVAGAGAITLAFATPAMAAVIPSDVTVGTTSTAGSSNITAASQGSLSFAAEKTDGTFLTMGCSSAAVPTSPASKVFSGTGLTNIAAINAMNFSGCTGPGGTLTVTTSGSWKLQRTGGTATSALTNTIPGQVTGITANVGNLVCKFTVTGKAKGSFVEGTQVLKVNEPGTGLKVSNIQGCGGQLKTGGKAKFTGSFKVKSPKGAINVVK